MAQQSGVEPLQSAGPLHVIVSSLGHEGAQYAVSLIRFAQHVSPLGQGTIGQVLPASPPLPLLLPPELPPLNPPLLPVPELLPAPELPLEASSPPDPLPLPPPLDELLAPELLPEPPPLDVPPPLHPAQERVPTMMQATPRESDRRRDMATSGKKTAHCSYRPPNGEGKP